MNRKSLVRRRIVDFLHPLHSYGTLGVQQTFLWKRGYVKYEGRRGVEASFGFPRNSQFSTRNRTTPPTHTFLYHAVIYQAGFTCLYHVTAPPITTVTRQTPVTASRLWFITFSASVSESWCAYFWVHRLSEWERSSTDVRFPGWCWFPRPSSLRAPIREPESKNQRLASERPPAWTPASYFHLRRGAAVLLKERVSTPHSNFPLLHEISLHGMKPAAVWRSGNINLEGSGTLAPSAPVFTHWDDYCHTSTPSNQSSGSEDVTFFPPEIRQRGGQSKHL